jgi:enamine deaminase RidA (YjgF/YER057c/UK114 family)
MKLIQSPYTAPPAGHYSHAVESNGLIFVSGVLPGLAGPGEVDNFERQVRACFMHCANILKASNCTLSDVVQCTAYIVGVANWPQFNTIYADIFGAHKPARAVVPVPELHYGFSVEVQLVVEKKA